MKSEPHSLQPAIVLLMAIGLLWPTGQTVADTRNQTSAQTDKTSATQSIDLGNGGEKARIDIKQVRGVDPKELAKVLDMLAKRDADARKAEQRVAELEAEQRKARESGVNRVLTQAAQPEADDLARSARVALLQGDSRLAEQLLRQQEDRAASAAEQGRREAAEVAREIAALAIGRNSQAALAALERAAKYPPEDFWTQGQRGDAQLVLGKSATAMISYQAAFAIAQALAARDPANTQWQRDLSISHDRIGDVLVAQGDGPGALAAFRKGLAIAEARAVRDPLNAEWQRDLILSFVKLGESTGDASYTARDAWRVDELKRRAGK